MTTIIFDKDTNTVIAEVGHVNSLTKDELIGLAGGEIINDEDDPRFDQDGANVIVDGRRYWYDLIDIREAGRIYVTYTGGHDDVKGYFNNLRGFDANGVATDLNATIYHGDDAYPDETEDEDYPELKAEIIRQAEADGIDVARLRFQWN